MREPDGRLIVFRLVASYVHDLTLRPDLEVRKSFLVPANVRRLALAQRFQGRPWRAPAGLWRARTPWPLR